MNIIPAIKSKIRKLRSFALAGESVLRPLTLIRNFYVRSKTFFSKLTSVFLFFTITGLTFVAAQDAEPAPEKAKSEVGEGPAKPAAQPKTADQQLEKLATETEKDAAAEVKQATETEKKEKAEKAKTEEKTDDTAKPTGKKKGEDEKISKEAAEKAEKKKGKKAKEKEVGSFRPDFRDQEIQEILKMFSKIIGKNIIADEKVKGKISVISPYKIPKSLAYPYLYSMLSIKGFGIIEENENLIRVVAVKDALAGSQLIFLGRDLVDNKDDKSDVPVTQILPVYGTKASRLSAILKRLTSSNTDLVDYDDINMLIISGSTIEVNRLIKVANLIDYQGPPPECDEKKDPDCGKVRSNDGVHVYRLENMLAENVEATLKKIQLPIERVAPPTAAPGTPASSAPAPAVTQANVQKKPIDIVGHKETNSIIFVGSNEEFDLVKSLVKRIDLQRQQVLLEVLIVEVGSSDGRELGIDWIAGKSGSAQFNSGIATSSGLVDTSTGKLDGSRLNTSSGFSVTFVQDSVSNIIGILNAKIGKSNFTVVSAPQVLTLDNQEAEINVGQDVPVRVNAFTNTTGTQSQSFEYRPVGVKLKFTPQVNKSRMVTLNLFQEVKTLIPASDPLANPTIAKKDIKTFVRVQDAQTIVIGGLVSNERSAQIVKVPILGEFPLIGYLFRRSSTTVTRKNLMVFITPHILTNRAIADKVTNDLKEEQIKENKRGSLD